VVGVIDQVIEKSWVYCIQYIKKEISLWYLLGEELIREIVVDFSVILDHRENFGHAYLLVDWHNNVGYIIDFEEYFLIYKDLLYKVFIIHAFLRQVILKLEI
jgi:hypothetical protein